MVLELNPDLKTLNTNTSYELNVLLPTQMNAGSLISFNFINSKITVSDGTLSICNNTSSVVYTNCNCLSQVCTITTTNTLSSGAFFTLMIGNLTNPPFLASQIVNVQINYANTTYYTIKQATIEGLSYFPGQIQFISLGQSSQKVGQNNAYSFIFKPVNNLLRNSKIVIRMPTEVTIQDSPVIQATIYDIVKTNIQFSLIISQNIEIIITSLFSDQQLQVNSLKVFNISVTGIKNPQSVSNSSSFAISITTQNDELIDYVHEGIKAIATIPEAIGNLIVTSALDSTINRLNQLFFVARPTLPFFYGGQLQIVFPSQFSISVQTQQCTKLAGLVISSGLAYNCLVRNNSLTTQNLIYPQQSTDIYIRIFGVINPNSTKPTDSFVIQTYDTQGNIMCVSQQSLTFQATPGMLIILDNITRSNVYVGNNIDISGTIQLANPIQANSYVRITIPSTQTNYLGPLICKQKISDIIQVPVTCNLLYNNSSSTTIQFQEWCSVGTSRCNSMSTMSFIIQGFQNPQYIQINNIDSLILSTFTPDLLGQYDQISSSVIIQPQLQANALTDITFVRLGSQQIADLSSLQISFTPTPYFMTNRGNLKIYFAAYTTYQDIMTNNLIQCSVNNIQKNFSIEFYQNSINSVKTIYIYSVCDNQCSGQNLNIYISNLRNPVSQYPLQNISGNLDFFGIQTYTLDNLTISFGKVSTYTGYNNIISRNINIPQVSISDLTIGITTRYQIQITPTIEINNLQYGGYINITFPIEVQITISSTCMALASSDIMLTCLVDFNYQTLQISHSLPPTQIRNNQLTIIINGVRSPQTSQPSNQFLIQSVYLNQYQQQIWQFQVQSTIPYPLQANINRNETQINKNVELTINFTNFNPIPLGSQIKLTIPFDQMVFPQNNIENFLVLTRNQQPIIYLVQTNSPQQLTIIFQEPLCPCPSRQNLVYNLIGGVNPNATRPPLNSIQIFIKDANNYDIESKNSSLIAEPSPSVGTLIINSILSSSLVSGTNTSLFITITPSNAIGQAGRLIIFFPSQLYFGSNAICVVNAGITPCYTTNNQSDIGTYIDTIQFVICPGGSCLSISTIRIEIRNLLNNPTTQSNNFNLILSTCEGDGYFIDTNSISAVSLSPTTPNVLSTSSIVRSNNTVDMTTNLDIDILTSNVWPTNSVVRITFPSDQIVTQGLSVCKKYTDQNGYQPLNCQLVGQTVIFQEFCSINGNCPPLNRIKIRIENLLNYFIVNNSQNMSLIEVQTRSLVSIEQGSIQITPNLVSSTFSTVSTYLSTLIVGQESFFGIQIILNTQQPPNSVLTVMIQQHFLRKSSQQQCLIYLNSIQIPSATCNMLFDQQYLISLVIQNFNPTQTIYQGQNLTIKIGLLNEFYCKALNNTLIIQSTSNNFQISSQNYTLPSIALQSVMFTQLTIIRSNTQLNTSVNMQIQIIFPTPLLVNSQILLALPKDQVQIQSQNIQCTVVNCNLQSQDSQFYYIQFLQSVCSDYCPNNYNLSFTILNIFNPTQKNLFSSNFQISTNYQGIIINTSPSGLKITPELESNNILGIYIQRDIGIKSQAVVYNLQISSTFLYESNSQLAVIFPDSLIFISNTQQIQIQLNNSMINSVQVTSVQNQYSNQFVSILIINNLCQLIQCNQQSNQFTITIQGINNPSYYPLQQLNDSVRIAVINQQQIVQAEERFLKSLIIPVFNFNDFQGLQLTRTDATLGQQTSLQLQFSLNYQLQANSIIVLTVPKIQVTSQTNISCLNIQNQQDFDCNLIDYPQQFQIQFKETCSLQLQSCYSDYIFMVQMNFLNNPTTTFNRIDINSADLRVISQNSQVMFSQISSDLFISPPIYVSQINDFMVNRDIQNAGMPTTYSFSFTNPINLQPNTLIIFQLPLNLAYTYISQNCSLILLQETQPLICQYITVDLTTQTSIIQVTISNLCIYFPSKCQVNQQIQVNLQMKNQEYVKDYQTSEHFQLLLNLNGVDFSRGYYDAGGLMPILPGIIANEGLLLSSYKVLDQQVDLSVNFTLTNKFLNIQNNGQILLQIPSILIQQQTTCTAMILMQIQQQITIQCKQIANNQFIIQHSLSQQIKNKKIMLSIHGIVNAPDNRIINDFLIQSSGLINTEILIFDKSSNQLQYQASILGGINVQVLRDNKVLYQNAVFTFIIMTEHAIQSGGSLAIGFINSNQAVANQSIPFICKNNLMNDLPCSLQGNYIRINNICPQNCDPTQNLTVLVTQGLMNVGFFMNLQPSDSFEIYTLSSSNSSFTDGNSTKIQALPVLSSGILGVLSFTQSSNIAQQNNILSLIITNRQSLFLQNNRLIIYFSRSIFQQNDVLQCTVNNILKNCQSIIINDYVQSISVDQICQNILKCSPGTSFQVTIQGFINYFYEYSSNSFINMTTYSSDTRNNYQIIDTIQFNKNQYLLGIIPAQLQNFQVTQFSSNYLIEFIFESHITILPNSIIMLTTNGTNLSFNQPPICREVLILNNALSCSQYNSSALIFYIPNIYLTPGIYSVQIQNSNNMMNISQIFQMDVLSNDYLHILQQSGPAIFQTRNRCMQPSNQPYLNSIINQCTSICPQYQANMECYKCFSNCLTCFGTSFYNCISCIQGFQLSTNQCVQNCPQNISINTYLQNQKCINNNSLTCNSTCTTCGLDTNFCYTCKPTLAYDQLTGRCLAPSENCSGLQYNNNGICTPCSFDCLQCGPSSINCVVCKPEFGRYVNSTNQCVQNCLDGFYITGVSCLQCQTPCKTCSIFSDNCTSCFKNLTLYHNQCVQCLPNYTLVNEICLLQCETTCNTCSILPNNCTSCQNNQILYQNTCIPQCLPNHTLVNGQCQLQCDSNCQTCSILSYNCTSCQNNQILYQNVCIAQCLTNYTLVNGTCQLQCDLTCKTCSILSYNCTSCQNNQILYQNTCIPQCLTNYTLVNGQCQLQCDSNCQTCSILSYNCTSCQNNQILYYNKCLDCLQNYTLSNGSCQLVCQNKRCIQCQTDLISCITCSQLYPIHNGTNCIMSNECIDGFYIDENQCMKCQNNCLTCDVHQNNCTSCNAKQILFKFSCLDECPQNYYLQNNTCLLKCINARCETCLQDSNTCLTCSLDYPIKYSKYCIKQSECTGNLFLNDHNQTCQLCDQNCKTCQKNPKNCTSCLNELILFNNSCQQQCPQNYSLNYLAEIKECFPFICQAPCEKCGSSAYECATCIEGYPYIYQNQCFQTCPSTTYSQNNICIQCSMGCSLCSDINICNKCDQDHKLYNDQCISECPQGWTAEDADGICISVQMGILGIILLGLLLICFIYSLISAIINKTLQGFWISLGTLIGCVEQISKGILVFYLAEGLAQYQFTITATTFMIQSSIAMIFTFMKFEILAKNEQQVNSFERNNPKCFKSIMTLSCILGVQLIRITEGHLLGIPKTNYYNSKFVYRLIIKQIIINFLVNLVQLGVSISILVIYVPGLQCFHIAYLNILFNSLIYCCYGLEKLNFNKFCKKICKRTDLRRVQQDISINQTDIQNDISQIQKN